MPLLDWYFISRNEYKYEELHALCMPHGINLIHVARPINERQLSDFSEIVVEKVLEAFRAIRSPVIVDHSGLELACLNQLPGGLTQLFWKQLGEGIVDVANRCGNTEAKAVTALACCDGRRVFHEVRHLMGRLVPPSGKRDFQWDNVFIPEGESQTYASMTTDQKNRISQRANALEGLVGQLKRERIL